MDFPEHEHRLSTRVKKRKRVMSDDLAQRRTDSGVFEQVCMRARAR